VLGELFSAHEVEIDDELLEDGPFERLQTVEAKGWSEVNFATLGEILQLGALSGRSIPLSRRVRD
jgi:hypothetical protein